MKPYMGSIVLVIGAVMLFAVEYDRYQNAHMDGGDVVIIAGASLVGTFFAYREWRANR